MGMMKEIKFYAAMIIVQFAYGGSNALCKLALEKGMSYFVFIVYRHIIAMLILGPFAYFLERKQRPPFSLSIFIKIFLLASLGTTIYQILYYVGLDYSSPTMACALGSVIPGLTLILAVVLRMEKLQLNSERGRIKLLGTIICIGGALIFTLWKGYLFKGVVKSPLIDVHGKNSGNGRWHINDDWIKGSAFILTSFIAYSGFLILQAKVFEVYPARLSINALICLFASLQCSALAIAFERKPISWRLQWNIQLLTIVYCGTVISALVYYLVTWCISEKGPVFVAMFSPLVLVVVGILSAFLFAERLHLGSVIGAFLIIVGLYCVLWGKGTDSNVAQIQEKETTRTTSPDTISMQSCSDRISSADVSEVTSNAQVKSDQV